MKVGDLVKCKPCSYWGIGIVAKKRISGGYIVFFPKINENTCRAIKDYEVISESR